MAVGLRIGLLAVVVALHGLQVPLCSLACAAAPASAAAAADPAAPCHMADTDPAPAPPPRSHEDCNCQATSEAWLSAGTPPVVWASLAAAALLPETRRLHDLRAPRASNVPAETDLPPPDLLLLESILLI